jgi:hypothetical protein
MARLPFVSTITQRHGQSGAAKGRQGAPGTRLTADSSVRVESHAGPNQTAAEENLLGADSGDW